MFQMPIYKAPDFSLPKLKNAPDIVTKTVDKDGVVPENFHGTSMYPEYFKVNGKWALAEESRMDSCAVLRDNETIEVIEQRNVRVGDRVILGRTEHGEEGIFVWTEGFGKEEKGPEDNFVFRMGRSRETAFSSDYDQLRELLNYEKENGNVVWVMGPACAFDADARKAMQALVENGYVHGLLAGNALATHDLEAAHLKTALGQNIYTQKSHSLGHYNHLDVLNRVRRSGSIVQFIKDYDIDNGIIYSLVKKGIPYVLTSSIRDDGPLPEVIADAYEGQSRMRDLIRPATTVICLATQLHTIAAGNMTPSFRVVNGVVRPLFIYSIDISEFVTNKLLDRGSLTATSITTNVQDYIVRLAKDLRIF